MKKIFAFVLASIMVLSLVPASAFAAISVDTPCPTTHTVANCDAVIVSTKDADCENAGYTIFKCTKCGEQFLGNIVAAGEHKWVLDENHEDTKIPSCTEGKAGQGHFECSVCGEEGDFEIPANELHDLVYVTGVGCEASYICTVCEGTFNSKGGEVGEHAGWELTEIITEPTAKATGLALFTCTAKKCGATKEVTINKQCECADLNTQAEFYNAYAAGKLVVTRKASKPTCTAKGKWAIYKCADCGTLYRWVTKDSAKCTDSPKPVTDDYGVVTGIENGTFARKNGKQTYKHLGASKSTTFNGKNENKTGSYQIPAFGHTFDLTKYPVKKVSNCEYTVYCTRCKQDLACKPDGTVSEDSGHAYFEVNSTPVSCTSYGIVYKVCQVCGDTKNEVTPPLEHDIATETYPSTCGTYGYVISYCKNNDKCSIALPTLTADGQYYDYTTGKLYKDVTVDHDGNGKDKVLRPIISITPLTELQGSHTFTTTQIIGGGQTTNCATGLVVMQQCKDCNFVTYSQIAPKGHTYGETTTVEATCFESGRIVKVCKECNYTDIIVLPKLTAHKYVETALKYNCSNNVDELFVGPDGRPYHGIRTMACQYGCAHTEVDSYIDAYNASSAKVWFESLGEANKYHGEGSLTLVQGSYRAPSCTSAGYGIYLCSKCTKTVYVTEPAIGHVPTGVTVAAVPATCTTSGLKAYNLCAICNGMIIKNDKDEYVTITAAQLVTNPHSATLIPVPVYSCGGGDPVYYYQCSVEGCGKVFADAEAKTPVDKIPEGNVHSWKVISAGVTVTCNNDGYPELRYCAICKTLEKNQYAQFLRDGKVVVDLYEAKSQVWENIEEYEIPTSKTGLSYVNGVYNKAADKVNKFSHGEGDNCPADWAGTLMNHEAYSNAADCDEEYGYTGHVCRMCGYEYITDFVTAAGGHYNIKGEKLEESCANYIAVSDRTCVNCDKVIGVGPELHNVVMGETVAPTCSTEGYTFNYCKNEGCTWVQVINPTPAVKPATYHKNAANLKVGGTPADYATVGNSYTYCPVCLEVIKVEKETKVSAAGLEIYLSTDAESYIPGATVYVTVTLDSLKGVKVWGLNFPVNYNADVFEFVGYEFNTATGAFQTFAANDVAGGYTAFTLPGGDPSELYTDGKYVAAGVVSIAANADDEVEIKGAQTLVTLEFKVVAFAAASDVEFSVAKKTVVSGGKLGEKHEFYPYYKFEGTSTTATFTADVVNGLGKAVNVNYLGSNSVSVDVTGYLDLDGKAGITMADAHALYALIYNNEYSVEADADFDGKVTAKDLSILYSILTGATTVEDLVKPASSTEIPEGWNAGQGAK